MTSKAEDKVEIVVQVESKDTSSKVILIMLIIVLVGLVIAVMMGCLLYTSPSPRDYAASRMPSSA